MPDLVITVHDWAALMAIRDAIEHRHYLRFEEPPAAGRVYLVAHGKVRGWSLFLRASRWTETPGDGRWVVHRSAEFTPCTIAEAVKDFRGFRVRWWDEVDELPFPGWREVERKTKGPIKHRKKAPIQGQGGLF